MKEKTNIFLKNWQYQPAMILSEIDGICLESLTISWEVYKRDFRLYVLLIGKERGYWF